jgi:hypothetical protein
MDVSEEPAVPIVSRAEGTTVRQTKIKPIIAQNPEYMYQIIRRHRDVGVAVDSYSRGARDTRHPDGDL